MTGISTFARALRHSLERATNQGPPWGDVNPLVVIGLTEAILDLNLSEDQIYAVVRSFARQLAAQVHPDRNPTNIPSERQRDIIAALDYIDDRENFTRALNDFRTLKSEDRREVKALRLTLGSLRREVAGFERSRTSLEADKKILLAERKEFEREKKEDPAVAPALRSRLAEIKEVFETTERNYKRAEARLAEWRARYLKLSGYVGYMGGERSPYDGAVFAFDARWVLVASLSRSCDGPVVPVTRDGSVKAVIVEKLLPFAGSKNRVLGMIEMWKEAAAKVANSGNGSGPNAMMLGLSLLSLECGKPRIIFGCEKGLESGGRVIGSLPPDDEPATWPIIAHQNPKEQIFEKLHPFIVPGGSLVFLKSGEKDTVYPYSKVVLPRTRLSVRRIVIAVG